jgi:hypothetical protein
MELGLELDELEELEELEDRELEELVREFEELEELEELGDDRELEDRELADAGRLRVPAALAIAAQICAIVAPSGTPRWRARANRRSTSRL